MMMRTSDDVKRAMTERLGTVAVELVWGFLEQSGDIADVAAGSTTLDRLIQRAEAYLENTGQWRKAYAPAPPMDSERGPRRMAAVSTLLAADAGREARVQALRRDVLGGRLLKWDDVEAWIQARAADEGFSRIAEVVLPADVLPGVLITATDYTPRTPVTGPILQISVRALPYVTPASRWVKRVSVANGGTLDRIREAGAWLAKQYGWDPAAATVFLLGGITPAIPACSVQTGGTATRPRFVLDVDPIVTPREVAQAYATARRVGRSPRSRIRPLSERHITLAVFLAKRSDDESWHARMQAWNRQHRHWRYTHESNFRRDAARARARLLAPAVDARQLFDAALDTPPTKKPTKRQRRPRSTRGDRP
jgi:hypothetical protein